MYLVGKGHTKIGFGGSDRVPSYFLRCFAGYQRALTEMALPLFADWILRGINDEESALTCLHSIVSGKNAISAICCMDDMCAIYAIEAAEKLGVTVPDELSFISIDDIVLSRYVKPKLTTVSYMKSDMGAKAAHMLLRKLRGEETQSVIVQSDKIIERDSVFDLKK